jgi:exodeoxyribonuclease VII small subunit
VTNKPFEFEHSLKELEEITLWFESTDVDLDQGLVKFERGMELAGQLKNHLATVENRVEKIKQRFSAAPEAAPSAPDALPDSPELEPAPVDDPGQTGLFR